MFNDYMGRSVDDSRIFSSSLDGDPSPYRFLYLSGVDIDRLWRQYRGSPRDHDLLIWERFSDILGSDHTDSGNVHRLIKEGALSIPCNTASILVQEHMGLCKERPYSTTGVHYVTDGPAMDRKTAKRYVDLELAAGGRYTDDRMLRDLCHGDAYTYRNGQLSMICPHRSRGIIPGQVIDNLALRRQTATAAISRAEDRSARTVLRLQALCPAQ